MLREKKSKYISSQCLRIVPTFFCFLSCLCIGALWDSTDLLLSFSLNQGDSLLVLGLAPFLTHCFFLWPRQTGSLEARRGNEDKEARPRVICILWPPTSPSQLPNHNLDLTVATPFNYPTISNSVPPNTAINTHNYLAKELLKCK